MTIEQQLVELDGIISAAVSGKTAVIEAVNERGGVLLPSATFAQIAETVMEIGNESTGGMTEISGEITLEEDKNYITTEFVGIPILAMIAADPEDIAAAKAANGSRNYLEAVEGVFVGPFTAEVSGRTHGACVRKAYTNNPSTFASVTASNASPGYKDGAMQFAGGGSAYWFAGGVTYRYKIYITEE